MIRIEKNAVICFSVICLLVVLCIFNIKGKNEHQEVPIYDIPASSYDTPDEKEYYGKIDSAIISEFGSILGNVANIYSLYLSYPNRKVQPVILGGQRMRSASMIKVFIMAAVMDSVKNGTLSLDTKLVLKDYMKVGGAGSLSGYDSETEFTIEQILYHMITESDNTATNMLIDCIGMDELNYYFRKEGYFDTILQRKMMDEEAIAQDRDNYTSVKDLGEFFSRLYSCQCVGGLYDKKMIQFLLKQADEECFPNALPNYHIAHKTGELEGMYDDGGIIYDLEEDKENDFILIIMDDDYIDRYSMIDAMRRVAYRVAKLKT